MSRKPNEGYQPETGSGPGSPPKGGSVKRSISSEDRAREAAREIQGKTTLLGYMDLLTPIIQDAIDAAVKEALDEMDKRGELARQFMGEDERIDKLKADLMKTAADLHDTLKDMATLRCQLAVAQKEKTQWKQRFRVVNEVLTGAREELGHAVTVVAELHPDGWKCFSQHGSLKASQMAGEELSALKDQLAEAVGALEKSAIEACMDCRNKVTLRKDINGWTHYPMTHQTGRFCTAQKAHEALRKLRKAGSDA